MTLLAALPPEHGDVLTPGTWAQLAVIVALLLLGGAVAVHQWRRQRRARAEEARRRANWARERARAAQAAVEQVDDLDQPTQRVDVAAARRKVVADVEGFPTTPAVPRTPVDLPDSPFGHLDDATQDLRSPRWPGQGPPAWPGSRPRNERSPW